MAKLPTLQNATVPLLQDPGASGGAAAAAAAPYSMIAEAFGQLGNKLDRAMAPQAQAEGFASVQRGPDGQLQVRQRMEWSDSDRAYNVGAWQSYRIQALDEAERGLRDLQRQFQGRPQEFGEAARNFTRDFLRNVPREMRPFVEGEVTQSGRQLYEGLMSHRNQLDQQREAASFQSRVSMLSSDLDSLAQQENGTSTPEYAQKAAELADLRRQMAANPRYAYTPEQMEADERDRRQRDITQGTAGAAYRMYRQTGDIAAAERFVEERIMDPALPLSAAERAKARSEAMSAITSGAAARQAQVAELRQERDLVVADLQAGREVDPTRVNDLIARLTGLRANADVYALRSAQAVSTVVRGFNGASAAERIRIYDEMRGLAGAGSASGVPTGGIINAESRGVANAQNPNSSARGLGQFIDSTWLEMVQKHRPDLMAGRRQAQVLALRDDPAISREMTQRYGEQNQARLRSEGLEPTAGNTYLMHFAGPAGGVALLRNPNAPAADTMAAASGGRQTAADLIKANPFLAGKTGAEVAAWAAQRVNEPGSANDATRRTGGSSVYAAAIREAQTRIDADAKKAVEDYDKAVRANQNVTDEEKTTLLELVARTSSQDVRDGLVAKLGQSEVDRLVRTLPPDRARQVVAELQRRTQRGEAGPVERDIARRAAESAEAAEKARATDPVQHFMDTQGPTVAGREIMGPPLPVVDTSSPSALSQSIDQRVRTGRAVEAFNGSGSISPFTAQDATAIGQAIVRAGPQDIGALLEALRTRVPEASLEPMLRQEGIKGGIEALARSNDPAKLTAAMQFLDSMQTRLGATRFEALVGATARERLDDWQTRGRSEDPVQFADRWSRADDPQVRAAREENRKAGERLARDEFTPEQIANVVTGRWLGGMRGSAAPSADMHGDQRGVLMQDWQRIMGEEYARYQGDKELATKKATERIQRLWGASDANGGRVMRHRPETVFEPVNGDHGWIGQQINGAIVEQLGRGAIPLRPDEVPSAGMGPAVRYGLLADRTTESMIDAYRRNPQGAEPPSYVVIYEHPITRAYQTMRFAPDRAAAMAPQRARDAQRTQFQQGVNEIARDPTMPRYDPTVGGMVP